MRKNNLVIVRNLPLLLSEVWALMWQEKNKASAKERDFRNQSTYTTASEFESCARHYVVFTKENPGKPVNMEWGWTSGSPWGYRFSAPEEPYGFKHGVYNWLLSQARAGKISAHNFGRGHTSGMRYRPLNQARLNAAEEQTMKAKERRKTVERPVHILRGESRDILCIQPTSGYGRSRWGRGTPRTTKVAREVTCPRCQSLLKSGWTLINYGINRKAPWSKKAEVQHLTRRAVIGAKWSDPMFHKLVSNFVAKRHGKDGFTLSGYALPTVKFTGDTRLAAAKAYADVFGVTLDEANPLWHAPKASSWMDKSVTEEQRAAEKPLEDFLYDLPFRVGFDEEKGGWYAEPR